MNKFRYYKWISFLQVWCLTFSANAWVNPTTKSRRSLLSFRQQQKVPPNSSCLYGSSSSSDQETVPKRTRASVDGVSLAPQGFWVMLRVAPDAYLPWQVTDDPADARAATSAEALTMIQLLSSVDMAGAILPPDTLIKLIVLHCEYLFEEGDEDELSDSILEFIQESLPNATIKFGDAHPWFQSRVKLPQASLDELLVTPHGGDTSESSFSLTCSVKDFGTVTFTPSQENLKQVLYEYHPTTSMAFTCLALALRYKAPITVINGADQVVDLEQVKQKFPMFATVDTLQKTSNRAQENIVRGFEIHKLTGALRIAMERGDEAAAAKIRQELDKYDSMDELPTAPMEEDNDIDTMQ